MLYSGRTHEQLTCLACLALTRHCRLSLSSCSPLLSLIDLQRQSQHSHLVGGVESSTSLPQLPAHTHTTHARAHTHTHTTHTHTHTDTHTHTHTHTQHTHTHTHTHCTEFGSLECSTALLHHTYCHALQPFGLHLVDTPHQLLPLCIATEPRVKQIGQSTSTHTTGGEEVSESVDKECVVQGWS